MAVFDLEELGLYPGGTFAGRYEFVRKLGNGGMGAVFEVLDVPLNRERLALKVFSPRESNDDPSLKHRFRNEVLITRKLSHQNIVRTYDFGELPSGVVYMTMEFVDGMSLDQLLKKSPYGHLDVEEASRILSAVGAAVEYAHENGVVHRDLKPGNVLVSTSGEVKVTDFGLAQMVACQERLTMTGECVGTPAYMSPEQVLGKGADQRSDIYALGMIAFELATGKLPFRKKGWFELANQIVNEATPHFATDDSGIPAWYESIVLRATEKEPSDRYASAGMLCEALSCRTTILTGAPIKISGFSRSVSRAHPSRIGSVGELATVPAARPDTLMLSVTIPKKPPVWTLFFGLLFVVSSIGLKNYWTTPVETQKVAMPAKRILPQKPPLRQLAALDPNFGDRSLALPREEKTNARDSDQSSASGSDILGSGALQDFQISDDELNEKIDAFKRNGAFPRLQQLAAAKKKMRENFFRAQTGKRPEEPAPISPDMLPRGYRAIR